WRAPGHLRVLPAGRRRVRGTRHLLREVPTAFPLTPSHVERADGGRLVGSTRPRTVRGAIVQEGPSMRVFRRKGVAVVMAFVAVVLIGGAVSASIPGPNGLIS